MTSSCYDRFKIVLLGESSVGKTCLLRQLVGEGFASQTVSTIETGCKMLLHSRALLGVDFRRKKFVIHNRGIELEIWDTAGQEKFRTITSFQYRNAKGILLVYDITNRLSFERIKSYWLRSISEHAGEDHLIPVFLAGNKLDLADRRQVTHSEGNQAHLSCSAYDFYETSSKTGENVQQLFAAIAAAMYAAWKPLLSAPKLGMDEEFGVCAVPLQAIGVPVSAAATKKRKQKKQKQQQQQRQPVIADRTSSIQLHKAPPPVDPSEKTACCRTA